MDLYIDFVANTQIEKPFSAFRKGFLHVCAGPPLSMCTATELELIICGQESSELDLKALERSTKYDDGFTAEHPVIVWFWRFAHGLTTALKKDLLNFVTASDRVPLGGLGNLLFVIQRNGPDTERLPSSLTCFGRLLLPEYSSEQRLCDRMITAIQNSQGFGLV